MANYRAIRIICNSNESIGYGHYYRCLIIAQKAKLDRIDVEWFGTIEKSHCLALKKLQITVADLESLKGMIDAKEYIYVIDINIDKDSCVLQFINSTLGPKKSLRNSFYFMNNPGDFQDFRFLIWPYFNPVRSTNTSNVILSGFEYFLFSDKINFQTEKPFNLSYDLALVMGATDPKGMADKILDNLDLNVVRTVVVTKSENVASRMVMRNNVGVICNDKDLISNTLDVAYVLCNDGLSKYELYKYSHTPFGLVADATANDVMQKYFSKVTKVKYFGDYREFKDFSINNEVTYYKSNVLRALGVDNERLTTKIFNECKR